jgi:hypothetical protein
MGQKLLVQEAPGSGSASTNRMEGGEGAGGGELHHFLHQYNQQSHSPGQSLQGGLPLPLSPQSLRHDGASSAGIAGVKREPEDLSSSRGGQQSSKRHKAQPESPTPPGMYHHHQHQLQVRQLQQACHQRSRDPPLRFATIRGLIDPPPPHFRGELVGLPDSRARGVVLQSIAPQNLTFHQANKRIP